ncbi:MAG: leucyl aminopeptidase [Melioribacteraceae bacterium]|nr:leucyl aminopeptidase [Melioribacteraceae bacterium]
MLFDINITSSKTDYTKNNNSLLINFFTEEKKLKTDYSDFLKDYSLSTSTGLLKSFLTKDKKEISFVNTVGKPDLIILKKVFTDNKFDVDIFRDFLSKTIIGLKDKEIEKVDVRIPDFATFKNYFSDEEYFNQTFVEGVLLGNYNFNKYKTDKKKFKKLEINFSGNSSAKLKSVISTTDNLLKAVYLARDLSNEPAITLTPAELLKVTKSKLSKAGVTVTAFNKAELKKRKMNAILAVAEGSINPPFLIKMHYKPKGKVNRRIALVGKGVTYDSGGYSIKPSDGMIEMNGDMSGASTVIGTIYAAALNKLPIEILAYVPAVENMISGGAYKPGDIISTASGKTIEVKNTDAEGRLVLADALEFASKQKPDEIIDFATLTGAIVVALGEFTSGLFTNNDKIAEALNISGNETFERVWRMPFWEDFKKGLDSDTADISNLGPRWGGAITAAKFLEQFVDDKIPYAHVDIAGPAIKHKFRSYTEKYNTGFGVRLMFDYLKKK